MQPDEERVGGEPSADDSLERDAADRTLREHVREGFTMALYVSLSLLAVMVALPGQASPEASESPALLIAVTALGLILAHVLAFRISARLSHGGELTAEAAELLAVQLAGGIAVAAVAVLPLLLIGGRTGVIVSELLLVGFIAVVGYVAARNAQKSRVRAIAYVGVVVAGTLLVLLVKNVVAH